MAERNLDILIFGGGIAALWTLAHLRTQGYDALLLSDGALGGTQTLASQGILHAGLKYALSGFVSPLALHIREMPQQWQDAIAGKGQIDLRGAQYKSHGQHLLVPTGWLAGPMQAVLQSVFAAEKVDHVTWPQGLAASGFDGNLVRLREPILDIPQVVQTLAAHYGAHIRQIAFDQIKRHADNVIEAEGILLRPHAVIFAAGAGNERGAALMGHKPLIKSRRRPLLMGFLKPAPLALYAHLVGTSDKPLATITTHSLRTGGQCWYIGGQVAERPKDNDPTTLWSAISKTLEKFFPLLDLSQTQVAQLPIDRIESADGTGKTPPDEPGIRAFDNVFYVWPSKLTFAPLLAQRLETMLKDKGLNPSGRTQNWDIFTPATLATPPWDNMNWMNFPCKHRHSAQQA